MEDAFGMENLTVNVPYLEANEFLISEIVTV